MKITNVQGFLMSDPTPKWKFDFLRHGVGHEEALYVSDFHYCVAVIAKSISFVNLGFDSAQPDLSNRSKTFILR